MKKILAIAVCLFALNSVQAQDFEKGGNYISLGYLLDPYIGAYVGNGISVNYERGITDVVGIGRFGVGGGVGTMFYLKNYSKNAYDKRLRISFNGRCAYHFEFDVPKMDFYAGAGFAIHVDNYESKYYDIFGNPYVARDSRVHASHNVFAGIRYYFTDSFGVFAEVGHGYRAFAGGIVFAF